MIFQGKSQWILISFASDVCVKTIEIQFQGGFVGKCINLEHGLEAQNLKHSQKVYFEDVNLLQTVHLDNVTEGRIFKLTFEDTSDFFGRVIIYKLAFY